MSAVIAARPITLLAALCLLFAAGKGVALEGRIPINDAIVTAASGTYPYVISSPGSYVLTGNLTAPDANTTAILITTSDVTLDLNGFEIQGPATCTVNVCSNTGTGYGIFASASYDNITVRGGRVVGAGNTGISLGGKGIQVLDMRVESCGEDAIAIGENAIVRGVKTSNNEKIGLTLARRGIVLESTFQLQSGGIYILEDAVVIGNTISTGFVSPASHGLDCGEHCVAQGNTSNASSAHNITASSGSVLIGNTANGAYEFLGLGISALFGSVVANNTANSNYGPGFSVAEGSVALDNLSAGNQGDGFQFYSNSGYAGNTADSNTGAAFQTVGGGFQSLSCNLADGTLTGCPP